MGRSLNQADLLRLGMTALKSAPSISALLSKPNVPLAFSGCRDGEAGYKVALHLVDQNANQPLKTLQHTGSVEPAPQVAYCIVDGASGVAAEPVLTAPNLLVLAGYLADYLSGLYADLETVNRCLDLLAVATNQDDVWAAFPGWLQRHAINLYRDSNETDEIVSIQPRDEVDSRARFVSILRFLKKRT